MATIKDVAREANVSIGTVSSVLNGKKTVKSWNYERVMAAVEKLQYQPNLTARALKTGTSNSIGLILPDITNPYYPELAKGVECAARDIGYTVFLSNSDRETEKEQKIIEALLNKNVGGIILVKPRIERERLLELQGQCGLVLVDTRADTCEGFDIVNVNNQQGVAAAMEMLFTFGHTKIAYVGGGTESISAAARRESYIMSLKSWGIEPLPEYIIPGEYHWEHGYLATQKILQLSDKPTAIFAATDLIAMGVLKALHERNVQVPRDISVIGFDDIDQAQYCYPALTTVRQPKFEVGTNAVKLLCERLKNPALKPEQRKHIELKTQIVQRDTVTYARTI